MRFLRLWFVAVVAALLAHAYMHFQLEAENSWWIAGSVYALLALIYVVGVTLYTRRLKIVPRQVHVTAL